MSTRVYCTLALSLVLLSGCAYDGSRFQYQSGGLPFLGMTLAVGNDDDSDAEIRRADMSRKRYGEEKPSLLDRVPAALRRLRAPGSVQVPEGTERVLESDYASDLNAF